MNTSASMDRIIAIDYFDGPLEGFAKISSQYFYFRKRAADYSSETDDYICYAMDPRLFAELEQAVGAANSASRLFVYSGADEGANRIVDGALINLRARADAEGRVASGRDLFDA